TEPAVFYNREDQWEVPSIDDTGQAQALMQPYYTIMRLPGEADAEFIQMLPFTPRRKDTLAAWLVARSDAAHYGDVRVFQFPKQKVVFGPRQVVARINQDQMISPQITLWNQQGSQVTWGTLMVIPIEESLIYVRPLYLRDAAARRVRLLGVEDLADGADARLRLMMLEARQHLTRAREVTRIHTQIGIDVRADEPRPDGALVIGRVARPQVAVVLRLVVAM